MTVYDLNRNQLTELKARYYADAIGRDLSYEELANIDFYVTDYDVQRAYEDVDFVVDDFFSSAGQEEEKLSEALERLRDDVLAVSTAGYIPFVSPYPSSTEKDLKEAVYKSYMWLDRAQDLAKSLRY